MRTKRVTWACFGLLALALVGVAACDVPNDTTEARQSAFTMLPGEFSRNMPAIRLAEGVEEMTVLIGNGQGTFNAALYSRSVPPSGSPQLPQWVLGSDNGESPGFSSGYRPFKWWNGFDGNFTTIYSDSTNSDFIMDSSFGIRVEPMLPYTPIGPPVALDDMVDHTNCAFGIYSTPTGIAIERSCLGSTTPVHWEDWGLDLPSPQTPTLTPNTSPVAFQRTTDSDSLVYACGTGATQVCEYRIGGPGGFDTFTTTFGSGAFATDTRPTGTSNVIVQNGTQLSADPWLFAATTNGSTSSVIGKRETSNLEGSAQPTYTDYVVDSTTANVTYSTPMPYLRHEGDIGLVYYRTLAGSTTRIVEASWNGSVWSAPVEIYDTGMVLPGMVTPGEAPVSYFDFTGPATTNTIADPGEDAVMFRLPFAGGVNDVVMLRRGPRATDGFTKIVLPAPSNAGSGLNLLAMPSTFDESPWTATNLTAGSVPDTVSTGPAGTTTEELHETTTSTSVPHSISQATTCTDRTLAYRMAVYLKADKRSAATLTMSSTDDAASSVSASVDLTSGLVTSTSTKGTASYLGSSVEPVGAGWFRVSLVGKPTTVVGQLEITGSVFLLATPNGSTSYDGNAADGLFAWGAELSVYQGTFSGPPAPTNLAATAGNGQVALTWTASAGAKSYDVYRGTSAGGESGTPVATGITTASYTNSGLTNGTRYYFKVAAVNASGTSPSSNEASATPSVAAPPAPTNLAATAGNAQVSLTWTASGGATSYNVYRGTSAGGESGTAVATGITTTSYTNTGLTNGTKYYFKVAAVNAGGTSPMSNEASATPAASTSTSMDCGTTSPPAGWIADTGAGGSTRSWTNAVNTALLTGTIPPQSVLQTGRIGNLTYTFTGFAANSSHTFTMYFVENYWTASQKRVFTVNANGAAKLSGIDIFALAGAQFKAVQRSFTATADGAGKILVTLVPTTDNASVEGIVVQ